MTIALEELDFDAHLAFGTWEASGWIDYRAGRPHSYDLFPWFLQPGTETPMASRSRDGKITVIHRQNEGAFTSIWKRRPWWRRLLRKLIR